MLILTLCVLLTVQVCPEENWLPNRKEEPRPVSYFSQRTRSLNAGYATDGDPAINDEVYRIFMLTILDGFNIFKIKMYNDRSFIYLTRRNYWLGDRYYYMDNYYYLATRDTCAYRMNETERQHLFYEEDNMPIFDIIYQCQRYQEYCCGLNCCKIDQIGRHDEPPKPPKYPWQDPWRHNSASSSSSSLTLIAILLISIFNSA
ncbi:CX domain-containing protein [Caenorhabditis elegans]|uniref:CX domain-containing protein n=1 Tax=Caenorhabditis elegans TaxID=6239 RepID=Q21133_CAEEL|nr:CX domain-containing protein [Caenorhabditis elegans]CCD72280.1 CX domain-containing protein [Caenorhabditis elegans]|eukprot:NP_508451.2 Uncharacterized protein CELE_K02E10.6 [Caenorhabditis elegans]